MMYYILKDKKAVPVSFEHYVENMKNVKDDDKEVAKTVIGEHVISTVFLYMDHAFMGGEPILFETMIFKGDYFNSVGFDGKEILPEGEDEFQERYSTYEEAEKRHFEIVEILKAGILQ